MTPKNSNRSTPCTSATTSTCTTWTGQNIPALGIETGQTVTDTVCKIAQAVVNINEELDLSNVDLSCLIDKTAVLPENKKVALILQLLLDNQCSLQTLIDNISGSAPALPSITVNMRCLQVLDAFGNVLPQDLNATLQSLVNQVCTNVTSITSLQATTISLQNQIDNIPVVPPYTEPSIITCITPTAKATSVQVPIITQDYCNYKNVVGQTSDIQQAIARQPQGLNTLLGTVDGWILVPSNLAQSENNAWLTISNLLARIVNIETNCCKVSCKDIDLVMQISVNADGDAISVQFSTFLGTSIPNGFLDDGNSVLTITDQANNFLQYPIVVSEDQTQGPFSFSGLDTSAPMSVSVSASLSSGVLTCEKCISKQFVPGASCPVCLVTGTGTTGSTTIVYTVPGSSIIQTLIVAPSSTGYIQKNAIIIGVNSSGDSGVSSTCINLAAPPYVCVSITYAKSGGTSTSVAWEDYNNDIQAIGIGYNGAEYTLSNAFGGNLATLSTAIAAAVPPGLIKVVNTAESNTAGVRYRDTISMMVPQGLVSSLYIQFTVADYGPLKIYAQTCTTCCPTPSSSSASQAD